MPKREMDVTQLRQRPDVARQKLDEEARARVAARKGKTTKVYSEPPRSQARGPITKGPRAYLECSTCSALLSTTERRVRVGVPKQRARAHLRAHRLGVIRRPS